MSNRSLATTQPLKLDGSVTLAEWQEEAVRSWRESRHASRGARHGIIEAVTGTGKTLAAIACMADASTEVPGLRFAVVVPGQLLAHQWALELKARLNLGDEDVGVRMTGRKASLRTHRIVVWVIDSARASLGADCRGLDVMLVVDECHRSGSAKNRRIYGAPTRFRLGLSATAQRQREIGEDGLLIPLERQAHARELGPTFVRLTVAKAEAMGILPPFRLVHHGLSLSPAESGRYRLLSQEVSAAISEANQLGLVGGAVFAALSAGPGGRFTAGQIAAAQEVQRATLARKHFLYLRPERARVAALLVAQSLAERPLGAQALLFHERIAPTKRDVVSGDLDADDSEDLDEPAVGESAAEARTEGEGADQLYERLDELAQDGRLVLATPPSVALRRHHSGHPDDRAFGDMRRPLGDAQRAQVLVSVKGAVEGVDLPNADLGVVVASSSSIRQRIQTLGRILRPLRGPDGRPLPPSAYAGLPPRTLHLLYIHTTVDDEIYQNTDWDELLGADRNEFRRWDYGAEISAPDTEPPEPPPSDAEAAAWALEQLRELDGMPVAWAGRQPSEDAQPLFFRGNAIRSRRDGPPLDGWEGVAAVVEQAAQVLEIPASELRGSLFLRVTDGLLIRAIPKALGPVFPVKIPGRDRPVPVRFLVLGHFVGQLGRLQVGGSAPGTK